MIKFTTTLERDYPNMLVVEVEAEFRPGSRGSRDSLGGVRGAGPALEPDEPDTIEIISVYSKTSVPGQEGHFDHAPVEVTDTEMERLESIAWSYFEPSPSEVGRERDDW